MPRTRKKRSNRRRPYRSRRRRYPRRNRRKRDYSSLKLRQLSGVPDVMFCRLKYSALLSLATVSDTLGTWVFSGNSIFDPDVTGVGGQPMGRDEWSAFYSNYYVGGSSIMVKFLSSASDATARCQCGVVPLLVPTDLSASYIIYYTEQPYQRNRIVNLSTGQGNAVVKNYMSTSKLVGYKTSGNSDYTAAFTTSPNNQWYWHVFAGSVDGTSDVSVYATIEIIYYVKFYGRKALAVS